MPCVYLPGPAPAVTVANNKYLNKFIDLGVEKAMKHHKFNNDEIYWWYILLSRIQIQSGLY